MGRSIRLLNLASVGSYPFELSVHGHLDEKFSPIRGAPGLGHAEPASALAVTVERATLGSSASRRRPVPARDQELFDITYECMRALAGSHAPDLDDLVQVAAEQMFRKLPAFEGRSSVRTWIYAICYRVLLQHRRWYRRWNKRFRLEQDGDLSVSDDDHQLPSKRLELRERARVLQAALSQLSERKRAVVVLHDLEELSIAEVASIVDCNLRTARSRLRDARKQLRKTIEAERKFRWQDIP